MSDLMRFQGPDSSAGGGEEVQILENVSAEELVKELEATVDRLKVLYNEGKEPINDNTIELARFCRCLEAILRHQQKEKLTFWSERKDYFHYLSEGLGSLKTLEIPIKRVQGMNELLSVQGKGRALIRICLMDQLLADCVQNSLSNTKKTKDWYNSTALLLNSNLSQRLISTLYDLSEVTFDLPMEGLDLDETWPSFVQKSFKTTESSPSRKPSTGVPAILKALTSPRDAKSLKDGKKTVYKLERAIEEHPSEIFVKQEIPFDISLVGTLFSELKTLLTEEFEGYSTSALPELTVTELDDITSGLTLLKDYITTMSQDVTKNRNKGKQVVSDLKKQLAEVEGRLKEYKEKEEVLEAEIENTNVQLATSLKQLENMTEEKTGLWKQVLQHREEISTLQAQNQQLQNATQESPNNDELESQLEDLQKELLDNQQSLVEISSSMNLLKEQLVCEEESRSSLEICVAKLEREKLNIETEIREERNSYKEQISSLEKEKDQLVSKLSEQESYIEDVKEAHEIESSKLKEELLAREKVILEVEQERDGLREEVKAMHGLVESETASLRFQLSTHKMELQQANEARSNTDTEITDLKQNLKVLDEEHSGLKTKFSLKKEEYDVLKQQLSISETGLQSLQEDLLSLNDQLTEKTLNRDAVREESLHLRRDWDDQRERMITESQRFKKQISKLNDENEYLRKVLQKLLQQKVSLWQHADELEQEQVSKGIWIDSKEVTDCMGCDALFSMFNRKHHCRSCGKVFCGLCCSHRIQLPSNRDPVRVCKTCNDKILSLRVPQASALVNTLDEEPSNPETSDPQNTRQSELINTFPGGVSLSDSSTLHLSPLDGSDESLLQHVRELVKTPRIISERVSLENSVEYSVDPVLSNTNITYTMTSTTTSSSKITDPDDEFCVIEAMPRNEVFPVGLDSPGDPRLDVSALRAKLATLETSTTPMSNGTLKETENRLSSKPGTLLDSDIQEVEEMEVAGGASHHVKVLVNTPRTVVAWQFSSQPKGLAVGLNYQEQEGDKIVEVLPQRRLTSHKTIFTGEYVAQKAGIYTLVFNNSHSKYSGRKLNYKVWKRLP